VSGRSGDRLGPSSGRSEIVPCTAGRRSQGRLCTTNRRHRLFFFLKIYFKLIFACKLEIAEREAEILKINQKFLSLRSFISMILKVGTEN
jgi:hypothetical protein